ncbi:unnamed protein product [Thlaspi arvense]|uniref:Hyaluronan/mRNA-binding protein domain-containing protein n=1 Tax=Thlaspi arvense TaxID=13288 RepID=A0AAU9SZ62_THLAR|nr:unnamed protein product [Thlaspi arvense]
MATTNPFDLLVDDDNDDLSQLVAAQQQKLPLAAKKAPAPAQSAQAAKLPSKPLPPAQAVREAKNEGARGGSRGGGGRGYGRGRGGGGFNRDSSNRENTLGGNNGFSGGYKPTEDGDGEKPSERRRYGGPHGGFRVHAGGGFGNGEVAEEEHPRRMYDRRSGTGRGNEVKREGAGRGNWGTPTDEIAPENEEPVKENEKTVDAEKQLGMEDAGDASKESPVNEPEAKEPEEKQTLL